MILYPPSLHRSRRRSVRGAAGAPVPPPPPVAPVLVGASFETDFFGAGILTLEFDEAVDVSGIVVGQIQVQDGPLERLYTGSGPVTVVSPSSLRVAMGYDAGPEGEVVLLEASGATGIVRADGGAMWAGTLGPLELPFPTPPPPALVVSVWSDGGPECTITFDQPITLIGWPGDGSILIAGYQPDAAALDDPQTLRLTMPIPVGPGDLWSIESQPAWVGTLIAFPQAGTFPEGEPQRARRARRKRG